MTDEGIPHAVAQPRVACPFCAQPWTEVVSPFGGNQGESLMQCPSCRTLFHWIKWQGQLPAYPASAGKGRA